MPLALHRPVAGWSISKKRTAGNSGASTSVLDQEHEQVEDLRFQGDRLSPMQQEVPCRIEREGAEGDALLVLLGHRDAESSLRKV